MDTRKNREWPKEDSQEEQQYVSVSQIAHRLGKIRSVVKGDLEAGRIKAIKVPSRQNRTGFEWRVSLEDANVYVAEKQLKMQQKALPEKLAEKSEDLAEDERLDSTPLELGTPDCCGSCGATTGNILGDINDETRNLYGYLCFRCHKLVTAFHGDPLRMRKVLAYIENTRPKNSL
jgi:hypothetical protein